MSTLYAPGVAGRWNSRGRKVIYASESIPLAFMETMYRRRGIGFNDDFGIMVIEIPPSVSLETIDQGILAAGWRSFTDYTICQAAGDNWYDTEKAAVLKVPSAILPTNFNYVINTEHPAYKSISIIDRFEIIPDDRIEDLLKRYPAK